MPANPYLGTIMPVAFSWAPVGWLPCDGRVLNIKEYDKLFELIGPIFGGDMNQGTFAVPDLRGRVIVGNYAGLPISTKGGAPTVALTEKELPSHNHTIAATSTLVPGRPAVSPANMFFAGSQFATNKIFGLAAGGEVVLATNTNIHSTGSGAEHENMQPYLAINYVIAYIGLEPTPPA